MTEAIHDSKKGQEDDRFGGPKLDAGLYLVATPIGNLRDITLRALDILSSTDLILAEDTRHSRRLLDRYGISTPMRPYHEHNADKVRASVLEGLEQGQAIALISDAGTPLISDPGFKLGRAVADAGLPIIPIPGPSAVLSALCVSGLPTDKFFYAGFPPPKTIARQKFFNGLTSVPATLIFFESPNRVLASLSDMMQVFGERPAVLARELTKIHETIVRSPMSELIDQLKDQKIRGECVLLLGPPETSGPVLSDAQIDQALRAAMAQSGVKAAAREVSQMCGLPVRQLYARALDLRAKPS